ncbi:MAG: hypothetical protein DRI36_02960 [Caldiserica bacterium]|nr:MAG: hypothetical protein DRI36_02960 [Caldisericota bacterium]
MTVNGNITANGDVQIFGRLLDKDGKEMIKQQTIEGKEVMVIEKETVIEKGMKVKDKIVIGEGTTVLSGTELYLSSELPKITLKDGYETKIWAGGVSPTTLPPYAEYGKLNFLAPGGFVFYNPDSNSPGIKIMDSNGEAYLQITHDGENYAIYKTSGSKGGHVFDKKITVGDIMGENSVITDNSVTCKNLRVKNKIYGPKPEGEPRVIIGDLLVAEKGINIPSGYKITGDGGGLKNVSAIYSKDSDKLDGKDSSFYLNTSATAQTKSGDLGIKGNLTVEGDLEVKGKINGTATNSERWDNLEYGVKFSRPARSPKTWYKNGPRIRFVSVTVWDPDSHDHQFKIKSPGGEKYTIFSIWMKGGHGGTVCGFVPPGWYYKVDSNAKWPRVWNWTEIDIGK